MLGQVLRRVLQAAGQPVELLAALVEKLLDLAAQGALRGGETSEQGGLLGGGQFGGSGGRRRPLIGGEVGDGEVGFVADTADHRQRTGADRPRHGLVVERPEVFHAAAAATDDQHFAVAALAGTANGVGDLRAGARRPAPASGRGRCRPAGAASRASSARRAAPPPAAR
jgi:hypothetical protein